MQVKTCMGNRFFCYDKDDRLPLPDFTKCSLIPPSIWSLTKTPTKTKCTEGIYIRWGMNV